MAAEIKLFACLKDNYGVLIHDPASGATAAIDAPEAAQVEAALKATGWKLTDILVTHHHGDHTGGIAELKKKHNCRVVAPRVEAGKIPLVDETVSEGDTVSVGKLAAKVIESTPETMWTSLKKLRDLPGDTRVYCGHEYTLANVKFAQTIEPDNAALKARAAQAAKQIANGEWTIPTTIDEEKAANPFLRADVASVAASLGLA